MKEGRENKASSIVAHILTVVACMSIERPSTSDTPQ